MTEKANSNLKYDKTFDYRKKLISCNDLVNFYSDLLQADGNLSTSEVLETYFLLHYYKKQKDTLLELCLNEFIKLTNTPKSTIKNIVELKKLDEILLLFNKSLSTLDEVLKAYNLA